MANFFDDRKQCRTWDEMATLCKKVKDALGKPLDPQIFEMVVALNLLGIVTTASCAGHEDHGTYAPYIDIKARDGQEAEQAERAAWIDSDQIRKQGGSDEEFAAARALVWPLRNQAQSYQLEIRTTLLQYLDAFYTQRTVSADQRLALQYHDNSARLESQGAGLQMGRTEEARALKLQEYQAEMTRFSAFLKDMCASRDPQSPLLP